jgi:hypothetical protein
LISHIVYSALVRRFILTLSKVAPPPIGEATQCNTALAESNGSRVELPYNFLADTDLEFDPQAFFNDYMFTGETVVNPLSGLAQS